ncbi:hypothetical protein EUGRSUZ_F00557 [Eucalyptus grandis]|uniref:Uncharacterized protein n=2 Tax=Eucalyptus grandis TaxID=71139 RepID=A0ACC3KC67_EUCGR|nr:hypothetical protein EUGRSUZ_F00557 [Eucalyptus grandis]
MVFASELEAYHKYVAYAIGKGFGVRKSKIRKNDKGEITRHTFVCNCEGYSINSSDQERKYEKHEVRCGCPAFFRFKVENGTYEGVLVDMAKAGIGGTTAYKYLANEAGGSQNLGFILRNCQNFLQYGRLINLFWRDSLSKFDYDCFGDVMVFDTTYRTNRYSLICAPFVGVNHHRKNTLFGCAFLLDETANLFIWLFEVFLKSMGNKAPKTIFTEQDHAMAKAIQIVFPNTQHRLCTWHIEKNANKNIPHLYQKPGFKDKYFSRLMYKCKSEDEFETTWRKMQEEWDTENNSWLQRLYDLRHKWSSAFGRDIFSCGIKSSQRSESTNNVFQQFSKKTSTLIQFVHYYEEQLKHIKEIENQDDYSSLSCECKLFESKGWLCRHALHILNGNISVSAIPSSYVLKRWTKGANAFEVMSLGAQDENTIRIAKKNLKATVAEIASYNSSVTMTNDASDDDNNEASLSEMPILDPLRRKGKEPIYGKLKSSSEKKKKNLRNKHPDAIKIKLVE